MTPASETPQDTKPTDRFIHLTDLHFWQVVWNPFRLLNKRIIGNTNVFLRRRHEFKTHATERFARDIASLGIEDVIITGDFSSTAHHAEFKKGLAFVEALAHHGLRPVVIPGNHDVYTFESKRRRRFEYYLGAWLPAETLPAVKRLPGGTPVLFVPTVCPNLVSSRGRITPEEVRQVRERLDKLEPPIVVAGHYPMLNETYGYVMKPNRRMRNAEALRQALGESGKRLLYIAGHVHRFSHVRDDRYPSITHLTTGALFRLDANSGVTGDFSEVCVERGDFRVVRHEFTDVWTRTEHEAREIVPA